MTYVPLWCKSNYSFLEGASHPEELVDKAADLGLKRLALTDQRGVYGMVRAFDRARERGIQVIVGAQVPWGQTADLVLLAQDQEGYSHLCHLLSVGHQDQEKGHFCLDWALLSGKLTRLIALWHPRKADVDWGTDLAFLQREFGDRLYAMICRHMWFSDPLLEAETLGWARRFGILPVASTEVLYHDCARQELQDTVTCIRLGLRRSEAGSWLWPNQHHALRSIESFQQLFSDQPEWIQRTEEIGDRCQFSLGQIEYRYPEEGVPSGYTTSTWLRHLTLEGAHGRYGASIPADVQAQLDKELLLIEELRYSGYFLTMWELVEACKSKGILCQGRGSAANSAVCFCLGITAVDPVRMSLLFERFLSRERAEPPDIDLDIEHRRREEVIQWMYHRYGRGRAAMVANVIRYRSRSALREVGKILGFPEVDLDRCSKLLSHNEEGTLGALRDAGLDLSSARVQALARLAGQLKGFPRHLSIHPGGFLLGSSALTQIVPVEPATMEGRTVIQWDKTDIETMNLFKVDLLGLGALTLLDYAFRLLNRHRGVALSMATIPGQDQATFDMICKADTVGVFQIESRAQMSMLPRLRPRNYQDLVIEVSLVRPGPISGGMVHPYLRRRAGDEPVVYPHPLLEPVLKKTLGVPLFQEQVMKLAIVAADYSPGEADQLRRDMAAWKQLGRIEQHRERIVSRMVAKGIESEFAQRVFDQIRGFGEYGFPESHAASFALIVYATAYVKCHHPEVFVCALLNAWPMGFYSPATVIGDGRRHGIRFLSVDIAQSEWDCTLEQVPGSEGLAVRIGFRYLRGFARAEAEKILSLGSRRKELTLSGWKKVLQLSSDTWEKLAVSGALERLGVSRRRALWDVLELSVAASLIDQDPVDPDLTPLAQGEKILWDYATMGYSPAAHLIRQFRSELRRLRFRTAAEVNVALPSTRIRYAGLVIGRQMPSNAHGVLFVSLEDETGLVNVVVWKTVWDRYRKVILTASLLGVYGKIQSQEGVVHIIAEGFLIPPLRTPEPSVIPKSRDFM